MCIYRVYFRIYVLIVSYKDEADLSILVIQAIQDKLNTFIIDDIIIENFIKNIEVGVETLNSATNKASGYNKQIFILAIVPSIVVTILEQINNYYLL